MQSCGLHMHVSCPMIALLRRCSHHAGGDCSIQASMCTLGWRHTSPCRLTPQLNDCMQLMPAVSRSPLRYLVLTPLWPPIACMWFHLTTLTKLTNKGAKHDNAHRIRPVHTPVKDNSPAVPPQPCNCLQTLQIKQTLQVVRHERSTNPNPLLIVYVHPIKAHHIKYSAWQQFAVLQKGVLEAM